MDLNLFENKEPHHNFIDKFIKELENALKNFKNKNLEKHEEDNELEEYNIYEKKKIFLDNKSRNGNNLAWIMDDNSVCISEDGDGGPISINEVDLPQRKKIGQVYEKINGQYVYNEQITKDIENIK